MNRNVTIITAVVALHFGALWALQTGSINRVVEVVVPIEILPMTQPSQTASLAPSATQSVEKPGVKPASRTQTPETQALQKGPTTTPEPSAEAQISPTLPNAIPATPVAIESGNVLVPHQATTKSDTSPSEVQYLAKPEPPYPSLSIRLGEEGRAVVRVLIGVDGIARHASIAQSSGFPRLDQASIAAVATWRYVPAKRNGIDEPTWINIPINWALK